MKRGRIQQEDAVSPVIGVMLMIVVTIIVAAVVSAFAGGLSEQQKKAPSAQIEVTLRTAINSSGLSTPQLVFTHKGGDPVTTRDLRIVTFASGKKHVTDGSLYWATGANHFDAAAFALGNSTSNDGYPCKLVGGICSPTGAWGNFTLMNGDVLTTEIDRPASIESILGTTTIGLTPVSGTVYADSGPITVEIVHSPSERVISSTELVYV